MSALIARRPAPKAPKTYQFSSADQARFGAGERAYFWRMPVGRLTEFAQLQPTALVTLAVLALHVWPTENERDGFTRWFSIPVRRLAVLAGLDKNTIVKNLAELQLRGWIQYDARCALAAQQPGRYRVSLRAYPKGRETYRRVPGSLFYGGWMYLLPNSAKKLVLLALALVRIYDVDAYLAAAEYDVTPEGERVANRPFDRRNRLDDDEFLEAAASQGAMSLGGIRRILGISRGMMGEAWRCVAGSEATFEPFPKPLLLTGCDETGRVYLMMNHTALRFQFSPAQLNDRAAVASLRSQIRDPFKPVELSA